MLTLKELNYAPKMSRRHNEAHWIGTSMRTPIALVFEFRATSGFRKNWDGWWRKEGGKTKELRLRYAKRKHSTPETTQIFHNNLQRLQVSNFKGRLAEPDYRPSVQTTETASLKALRMLGLHMNLEQAMAPLILAGFGQLRRESQPNSETTRIHCDSCVSPGLIDIWLMSIVALE